MDEYLLLMALTLQLVLLCCNETATSIWQSFSMNY